MDEDGPLGYCFFRRLPLRACAGLRRRRFHYREVTARAGGRRRWRTVSSRGPEWQAGQRCGHEWTPVPGFFGFTRCPEVCPTTLFYISEMLRRLGKDADRTGALFITVDPERDTPVTLKDYLSNFDPHLRGLTGDPAAVRRRRRLIGFTPRKFHSKAATIRWTTRPSSISWTRTAISLRHST